MRQSTDAVEKARAALSWKARENANPDGRSEGRKELRRGREDPCSAATVEAVLYYLAAGEWWRRRGGGGVVLVPFRARQAV